MQRRKDLRRQLQRRIRVVVGEDQVAAALAQRMHRLTDVGGHQPGIERQALAAQAGNPFGKETQGQRMRGGNLQHLALLAFEVVQVAHHLAQLLAEVARGDQKQLPGLGQLHRRMAAVDQGQAEGRFQAADAPAERRLGNVALLRRLGKAAGGGQSDEVLQPLGFQIHRSSFAPLQL